MESYDVYEESYCAYFNVVYTYMSEEDRAQAMANYSISPTPYDYVVGLSSMVRPFLSLLLCTAAIVTNITTLAGISKIRTPLTSHLMLVASLCSADLLIGVGHLFMEIAYEVSRSFCPQIVLFNINFAIFLCSILNIAAMAVDHYIAIVKTGQYDRCCSRVRSVILIVCIWMSTMSVALLGNLGAFIHKTHVAPHLAYCDVLAIALNNMVYLIFPVAAAALGILGCTYIQIYRHIRASSAINGVQGALKLKYRAAMTTVFIIVTFTLTWIPLLISWVMMIAQYYSHTFYLVAEYLALLPVVNAICNPVLYALRIKKVKAGVRAACCCCCQGDRPRDDYEFGTVVTTNQP